MSSPSRAFLYLLVRAMKPAEVVEIGTFFAGTTELLARALWENGAGIVHTVDPFGGDRCPFIIKQWPEALQSFVKYYAMNSMEFFNHCESAGSLLDLVLIDGNHEFEFASFDLQMASRLIRPGGVIVMDNAEQSGPFWAGLQFLARNPGWMELGSAVERFKPDEPFAIPRSSIPDTTFLVLQAPQLYALNEKPRSWGQQKIGSNHVKGVVIDIAPGEYRGTLNYHLILRAFRTHGGLVDEYKATGKIAVGNGASRIEHELAAPLISNRWENEGEPTNMLEIELAWQGEPRHLHITSPPQAL